MAALKATAAAQIKIKKILADRETETADILQQIEEADKALKAANEALEAATAAGNIKAYQEAKAEKRNQEDIKEMYQARYEALKNKPLISRSDYEKTVNEIIEEVNEYDSSVKAKLFKLSNEMHELVEGLQDAQIKANKTLENLQEDIYKNADRKRGRNGEILYISSEKKAVNVYPTIAWGNAGVKVPLYRIFAGLDPNETTTEGTWTE